MGGTFTSTTQQQNEKYLNYTQRKRRNAPPEPDPQAEGNPHTIIERPGPQGQYTTHNGDGTYKQYRGSGKPHGCVPRPNVKETKNNESPYGPIPGKYTVREAEPAEIRRIMEIPKLEDYNKWKDLNKDHHFSMFDYIFHKMQMQDVDSDVLIAILELFWPSFVVHQDYVFLKEAFSKEKADNLIKSKKDVEFWMNILLVDPYFGDTDDEMEKAKFLANSMKNLWEIKLKHDFPKKNITVQCFCDDEADEYGLTFYQKN